MDQNPSGCDQVYNRVVRAGPVPGQILVGKFFHEALTSLAKPHQALLCPTKPLPASSKLTQFRPKELVGLSDLR